jgi:hypothetical protein
MTLLIVDELGDDSLDYVERRNTRIASRLRLRRICPDDVDRVFTTSQGI